MILAKKYATPGVDPEFLKRGFLCIKVKVVRYANSISFFLNISGKCNNFGLTETKLFHFHRIFKNVWWGGGPSKPLTPPLDPPLHTHDCSLARSDQDYVYLFKYKMCL